MIDGGAGQFPKRAVSSLIPGKRIGIARLQSEEKMTTWTLASERRGKATYVNIVYQNFLLTFGNLNSDEDAAAGSSSGYYYDLIVWGVLWLALEESFSNSTSTFFWT